MQPDVSIIVVTWNARDHIDTCLEAVFDGGGADGVDVEVIVVDNDSTDDTVAHVRANWPQVDVIETGRNGGMAAGNNAGMLAARGSSFLLLNSDAFLQPGALRALVDRLERDSSDIAAVAPRLQNTDGSPQRSIRGFPTVWRYATEFFGLRRIAPRSRMFNAFYGAGIDTSRPGWVEWVTGACFLVPRAAVDEVGLMDEAYFMYGEEVDWLDRMRAHGRRVAWEPAALAIHVGGGSAKREWGRMYQVQLQNHVRYMAVRRGPKVGRRTQRVLGAALTMRGLVWRCLSILPGNRAARRARAAAFMAGIISVYSINPDRPPAPEIPDWPALQRTPDPAR